MKNKIKKIISTIACMGLVMGLIPATTSKASIIETPGEISYEDNIINLELYENPSTGCTWQFELPKEYLELVSDEYVQTVYDTPSDNENAVVIQPVGVGGTRKLKFKGLKEGSFSLHLSYGRLSSNSEIYDSREYSIELGTNGVVKNIYPLMTYIDDPEEISYKKKRVYIKLAENPSTGYTWEISLSNKKMKVVKDYYESMYYICDNVKGTTDNAISNETVEALDGRPTYRHFVLKGLKKGTCTIKLKYKRSFEKKAIETKKLKITIGKDGKINKLDIL